MFEKTPKIFQKLTVKIMASIEKYSKIRRTSINSTFKYADIYFNSSLSECIFPEEIKKAKTASVCKKG